MISEIKSRTTFLRVSMVTPGLFHARDRSSPRASNRMRSASWIDGAGAAWIWLSCSSKACRASSFSFQRRSRSAATSRFSGSTVSY